MKHQFTNDQLSAAIDAACKEIHAKHRADIGTNLVLDTNAMPGAWESEKYPRLHLLKTALGHLPDPPPPVVHGKTPGQWLHEASRDYDEKKNGCYGWKSWEQTNCQDLYEHGASAVLAAFGQHSLATLAQNQVSLTPEQADVVEQVFQSEVFDTHFADIRLPESQATGVDATKSAYAGYMTDEMPEVIHEGGKVFPVAKPTPETFTAHGKTWFTRVSGDPMPCDGEVMVEWILESELHGHQPFKDGWIKPAGNLGKWANIAGWRYADEPSGKTTSETTITPANPVQDMALGGQMYWRDLARQLAQVWWKCHNIGASLQHGDIDTDVSFSVVCEKYGGQCFHADTPENAWHKAEKWLMSPDRENFPVATLTKADSCKPTHTPPQKASSNSSAKTNTTKLLNCSVKSAMTK